MTPAERAAEIAGLYSDVILPALRLRIQQEIALAVAEERGRCAAIAATICADGPSFSPTAVAREIAARIRAGG